MTTESEEPHASLQSGPRGVDGVVQAVAKVTLSDDTGVAKAPSQAEESSNNRIVLLESLKASLAHAGLYVPTSNGTPASHDDATLLRFLRARLWNVDKAQKHFVRTDTWRRQHDVDALFKTFDIDELESSRRFYPRWTGRRDKRGLPLYVYRLASVDSSLRRELDAVPSERRHQRIIMLYECMTRFVFPLCDCLPHEPQMTPISSVMAIIDLGDMSLRDVWSLRSHLQQASTMATANYPETLNIIAIVNSPSFFPVIWNWVKGWFDEGTRHKIHMLGKDPGETLRELVGEEDLPESYGGKLKWVFEDEPCLDNDIRKAIVEMPKGPVIFMDGNVARP